MSTSVSPSTIGIQSDAPAVEHTPPDRPEHDGARRPQSVPQADWAALEGDYALIRRHIAAVIPGFDDFEGRIEKGRTLFLPNGPRDGRSFATATGKAMFTANPLEYPFIPHGRLLLQTLRSHDQYNTTIYGKDDRYRGIHGGRRVIMVNPKDIQQLGFAEATSSTSSRSGATASSGVPRSSASSRTPRRGAMPRRTIPRPTCSCRWTRSPIVSGTPTSKSVIVRLERRPSPA